VTEQFLTIDGVGMSFGGVRALDAVSFAVEPGAVVGLIGPNGSGKTTLLNVLSGVYKPTTGGVHFRGRSLAEVPAHAHCRLGIGRTFQVVKPFANLSVRENVVVGAMYGREGARRSTRAAFAHADDVLVEVGLARVAQRPASALTIADRKRLEVAKALAVDPELLLLDEVMAGLTPAEIDEALVLLRTVHARGVTLIVVEHVMQAIVSISTRVVVLAEGRKIADGSAAEVLAAPQVVEAYLGSRYAARRRREPSA